MTPFCLQALDRLKVIGLPTQKHEAFQYVPLRKGYEVLTASKESQDSSFSFEKKEGPLLVFQDGVFCPELSHIPDSFIVLSLQDALKSSYGSFLKHRLQMLTTQEQDPFALLNLALTHKGLFIYAPPSTHLTSPLEIVHVQKNPEQVYAGSRIHFFVGANAEVQVISSLIGTLQTQTLYSDLLDVSLEEGASFSQVTYTEETKPSSRFSFLRASLKKDSRLNSFLSTFGSSLFRSDYRVSLLGEGSSAELNGLSLLKDSQSHIHVHMEHSAPSCLSHQFFKNVLAAPQSRSSFTGKIHVKRPAQKTVAYQLNQNLLLSEGSIANTKPNLEIFADDVKASHGATISQIDEDQVFYLKTRGVSPEEAKSLLTVGFCQAILDKIPFETIRAKLRLQVIEFLKQG